MELCFYCLFIRYQNIAQNPSVSDSRYINFIVNDGMFNSSSVAAVVGVVPVNDLPIVSLGVNDSIDNIVEYIEGQSQPLLLAPSLNIQGN